MTRKEHLLWILAEECAEVAQRASKAARFGLEEVQPGQPYHNLERLVQELNDLWAVVGMLNGEIAMPGLGDPTAIRRKHDKIEKFLEYSRECGTLHL